MITKDQVPQVLADPLQTLKTPVLAPQVVAAPAAAPVNGNAPSVQALSGNPTPTPVQYGHFQKALIDGANEAASSDPNAAAPGSWARHLLSGASKALSGVSDVSTKPGGSIIAGIAETMANRNQRLQQDKELADKQAQLAKENERADKQLSMEQQKADDLHAFTTLQTVNLQKSSAKLDEEATDKHIADGKTASAMFARHHQPLDTGVPESALMAGMVKGGKYDPDTTRGFQTGVREVEVGGKMVPESTYDVFQRSSEPVEVDAPNAALLDKYGSVKFPAGSKVDGDLLDSAITSAQAAKTSAFLINKANDDMDIALLKDKEIKENAKDLTTVNPFLAGTDDPITALQKIQSHKDNTGKPTEEAQAASRLLMRYDPKDLEAHRHNLQDESIKREEADFKKAAKNEFSGDTSKLGQFDKDGVNRSYLGSLQPDERALVMAAGSGRLSLERWDYLLSHSPDFAAAVASTFKNFDSSKMKDYVAAAKEFAVGGVANSLNAAGAMAQHLKDLYDKSTVSAQAPFSITEDAARRKAIVGQLAPESIKFFSGSKAKPGEQETAEEASKYDDRINRRTYIQQKAENALKKLNEFKQQWANSAPSDIYQAQMPWISPQAQHDLAYILAGGKEPTAEQLSALGPGTPPPGGLNQQNAPAFNQQPETSHPTVPSQAPPAGVPSDAMIVTDPSTGKEYYGNPTTKQIYGEVPIQSSQISGMAAAARQAALDAQHKAQTHGTGR